MIKDNITLIMFRLFYALSIFKKKNLNRDEAKAFECDKWVINNTTTST